MSESSAEKTKRNELKCLGEFHWEQQTSVFPELCLIDYEADRQLAKTVIPQYINQFKDKLRRTFNDVGMLVILRKLAKRNNRIKDAYSSKPMVQLYLTIYSSQKLDKRTVKKIANATFEESVNIDQRSVTEGQLIGTIDTIKQQELHDLKSLLPANLELKRITKLNAKHFIKRDSPLIGGGEE